VNLLIQRGSAAMPADEVIDLSKLSKELQRDLEQQHGPLLSGDTLVAALGYPSAAALRQARRRGKLAVPMFTLPGRRGYFSLTRDVAYWLAQARATVDIS